MRLNLTVNEVERDADEVHASESLLFVLRERLGLPGSKNACEQGECGSCTVYLNGIAVCSCLVAAGQAQHADVRTVEGLCESESAAGAATDRASVDGQPADPRTQGSDDTRELHPVQRAFLDAGAVQCGFCTPGLLVAVHELLSRDPEPPEAEVREALAGNLCRCTGYEKILDAVRAAGREMSA